MTTLRLPPLADVHVHTRQPGGEHKEDWDTATAAALAGGITTVLAMPNTAPPVTDAATFTAARDLAGAGARCDYAQYLGAGPDNAAEVARLAPGAAGLKMYLNQTYGPLRLDDLASWVPHLEAWPQERPIVAHAEGPTAAGIVMAAHLAGRPIHLCHLSRRDEIEMVHRAREAGIAVTCEVAPHHLFLTEDDAASLGPGRAAVRPPINTADDRKALWEHLEVIDCFATDHAPHLAAEKDGADPPPGFPGVETMLPLLLTGVHQGLLTLDDVIERLHTRPAALFSLPEQPETWVEVDPDAPGTIDPDALHSRAGWTPFADREIRGRVTRVVLRGEVAYDGTVRVAPGTGRDLRREDP